MRDVSIVTTIYCFLFIILTTPTGIAWGGMSVETANGVHHFLADMAFWAAALYICVSGSFGAFARQDRFGLSQGHPFINRIFSFILLLSPFIAVLFNVRFVYVLLGLLLFSHLRSHTPEERKIEFTQSRAVSNIALILLFTVAMMLMAWHDYAVGSIFAFGSMTSEA